ncbi:MAG: hypothetical protein WBQ52_02715, partial [Terracidiphilus sp.]
RRTIPFLNIGAAFRLSKIAGQANEMDAEGHRFDASCGTAIWARHALWALGPFAAATEIVLALAPHFALVQTAAQRAALKSAAEKNDRRSSLSS